MKKLEEEPESYDSQFTSLTKGVNLEVQDWIFDKIQEKSFILEIGCGTGSFASKMAVKGNQVIAIDKDYQMINYALKNFPSKIQEENLLYQIGNFNNLPVSEKSQDIIVSTFMLSELRPLEQQIFLRNAWKALKPTGRLIIAAEFVPSGIWSLSFKLKRWRYKKKLKRLKLKSTQLIKNFFDYISPIGFKIKDITKWQHGSIQAIEMVKINNDEKKPGYYKPQHRKYTGITSQLRIYRCTLTGQIDNVPIEPGIYQSGSPGKNSPILITANYDFTYIKLMRDLKGIDAWVIAIDSNGINVWCAARGNDFGNDQILEAIEATGIQDCSDQNTLILPQLSAGGVSIPKLPKGFPYSIKYGPVWSKHLPEFLKEKPSRKPNYMKLAKFSLYHRIRAGTTHTTFLLRKIFIYPLLLGCILLLLGSIWDNNITLILYFIIWIIGSNAIISVFFPMTYFTRKFIIKGIFFGIVNSLLLGGLTLFLNQSLIFTLLNMPLIFWFSFFSTMSFSGYSMATSPREIQLEYPLFKKINMILLMFSIILSILAIFYY